MTTESKRYQDASGKELKAFDTVNVPFKVRKIDSTTNLVHMESVDAYGHKNPLATDEIEGLTKTAFWAHPEQLAGRDLTVGAVFDIPFRVLKLGGHRSELVHLETVQYYGPVNAGDRSAIKGRGKPSFWAEPGQIGTSAKV